MGREGFGTIYRPGDDISLLRGTGNSQLLHPGIQRGGFDSEDLGGSAFSLDPPAGSFEHVHDMASLDLSQ